MSSPSNLRNFLRPCLLALVIFLFLSQGAFASLILVGDANLGGTGVDSAGSRINIELDGVNLPSGTYSVMQYEVDTSGTGNVTPLLFQRNVPDNGYTVLWVGNDVSVSGTGAPNVSTTNYAFGSEQFILTSTTDVFVGAWHDGAAKVRFNFGGATDHDGGATQSPTTFAVGQNLLDSDITNSGLGRTYMIGASIAVPEPSTFTMLLGGLVAAVLRRRRRQVA